MAQNLLSCAVKLERASKRKQKDIWMRQSMQDMVKVGHINGPIENMFYLW